MAEILYLEKRHDAIFLDKTSQFDGKWHVDCGDIVDIETGSRIQIWRM